MHSQTNLAGTPIVPDLLRALLDKSSDAMFVKDCSGRYVFCNAAGVRFIGKPLDQILGHDDRELFEEAGATAIRAQDQRVLTTGTSEVELRYAQAGGVDRYYQVSKSVYRDSNGEIHGVLGIASDITERTRAEEKLAEDITNRKAAEQKLEETVRQLRSIYEAVNDVIYLLEVEPDGYRFQSVNSAFSNITGLPAEAVIGRRVEEVIPEPSLSLVLEKYQQAIRENRYIFWEETTTYPNGELVGSVNVLPIFDESGRCTHLVGTVHDITDRKAMEIQLRKNERRYRQLGNSIPHIVFTANPQGGLTFLNDRAAEYSGMAASELMDWNWETATHPDDFPRVRQEWLAILATGVPREIEFRIRRWDGEYRWHIGRQVPSRDANGVITEWFGTCTDIEDLRRTKHALYDERTLLRTLIDTIPDPIFVKDSGEELVMCNRPMLNWLGVTSEDDIFGKTAFDFQPPSVATVYHDEDVQVLQKGTMVRNREELVPDRNGNLTWRMVFKAPIRDEAGHITGLVGMSRDIQAWKRQERAFQEREELLRIATGTARVGLAVINDRYEFCFVNEAYIEIHRLSSPDIIGQSFHDVMTNLFPQTKQFLEQALAGQPTAFEIEVPESNVSSTQRWLRKSYEPFTDISGRKAVTIVVVDITDAKRSESAAKTREEQYRIALTAGVAAAFRWDATTQCVVRYYSTEPALPANLDVPEPVSEFILRIHPEDREAFRNGFDRSLAYGTDYRNQFRLIRPDGTIRWIEGRGIIHRNANGEALQVMGIAIDVTDRQRAQHYLAAQHRVMEAIAARIPLLEVLNSIVALVENELAGSFCSILLCDHKKQVLRSCAAQRLPEEYNRAVVGVSIREGSGSCGTSAARGKPVFVEDIANDSLWKDYRDLALHHGLRSCWSVPIIAVNTTVEQGGVLGTFAVYQHKTGTPNARDIEVIDHAVNLARMAIEQTNAQRALKASEELFRTVVEQAADAFFLHDTQGTFIDVNRKACDSLGYRRDELLSINVTDLISPTDVNIYRQLWKKIEFGKDYTLESEFVKKSGKKFNVEIRLGCVESQGRQLILALVRDISNRKEMDRQLRLMQFSIDNAVDPVFWISPSSEILYVNDAACQTLGFERNQLVGQTIPDIDLNFSAELWKPHWEELKSKGSLTFESDHLTVDGRTLKTEVTANYLRYEGREYNCAVMRDITEKKRLQLQFFQAQKMEAVGQLAGGIAHDFNNLLTVITGYSDMLLMDTSLRESQRVSLHAILDAGERAARLTHQLLAFSRKAIVEPKIVDVNEIVEQSVKLLRRVIGKRIILSVNLSADLPSILADPGQIEQVIMNLVLNSRDAMPEGGMLTIQTHDRTIMEENLQAIPPLECGRYVELIVADNGCGMSDEVKSHLFEPFFTTKGIGKGTGLGLAVVHGVVQQSHGSILVESNVDTGTSFRLMFPAVLFSKIEVAGSSTESPPLNPGTVLLVEDETIVRSFTKTVLERHGFHVLEANDGTPALQIARNYPGPIQLLVTDIEMPEMGGRQLADLLAAMRPEMKVLYMSGYTDNESLQSALNSSRECFISKPFAAASLIQKIRGVLEST
ncbi:MAG: PAS domain S-box protein [Planctomycetaceae bacterium]